MELAKVKSWRGSVWKAPEWSGRARPSAAANRPCPRPDKDNYAPIRHNGVMTDDDIIQLIENFDFDAGPFTANVIAK
jgi:hypothetical protein